MQSSLESFTLAQLATLVGGEVQGDDAIVINGVHTLAQAGKGQISFLTNPKYRSQLANSHAEAVIVHPKMAGDCPLPAIVHGDPHVAFAKVAQAFDTTPPLAQGIHNTAVVADSAVIGEQVSLGANCVIEAGVELANNVVIGANTVVGKYCKIGEGTILHPNVTLYHSVQLGSGVVVHSQTVVGSDGFGYANDKGTWLPIPQTGSVIVGNNTQIGASVTIDRGALENTMIGTNVIIDDQVHIAHNCIIGDHSCICGATGMAGSVVIGKHVVIAGSCAINGHISICDNVQITGFSMIINDITEPGVYSSGQPIQTNRAWRKNAVRIRQLESLYDRVKELEKKHNTSS